MISSSDIVSFDAESSSAAPLQSVGARAYMEHASTIALMFAWHPVGDPSPPRLWCRGDPVPEEFVAHVRRGGSFTGWNVIGFDRLLYRMHLEPLGFPPIPDDNWRDSMHLAAAANLPRSLDGCAKAVGLTFEVDLKDTNRIRRITDQKRTPLTFTTDGRVLFGDRVNGGLTPKQVQGFDDDMTWLRDRCVQDVVLEEQNMFRLPPWPDMRPWISMPAIDRRINDRGILLDMLLVDGMERAAAKETSRLDDDMDRLTRGAVPKTTNIEGLKHWLVARGVDVPRKDVPKKDGDDEMLDGIGDDDSSEGATEKESPLRLRKNDIANLLATEVPEDCRLALFMRMEAAKASVRKLRAMRRSAARDGALHGMLSIMGAQATGRFSSGLAQVHNLVRDAFAKDYETIAEKNGLHPKNDKAKVRALATEMLRTAIEAGRTGDPDLLRSMYESPRKDLQGRVRIEGVLPWVSRMMRRTIGARNKCLLLNGDFSNIQARIPVWLAGQQETVDAFARGEDLYRIQAAPIYNMPPDQLSAEQRQIGKVCVAEGSLVLTDKGLVPIENVSLDSKVWDGVAWVSHDGPVFRGYKETMIYDGLEATFDHEVFVWKDRQPTRMGFREASACYFDLVRSEIEGCPVRVAYDNIHGNERNIQRKQLRFDSMQWLWQRTMDVSVQSSYEPNERLSTLQSTSTNSNMVDSDIECRATKMSKSSIEKLSQLRRERDSVLFSQCYRSRIMDSKEYRPTSIENDSRQEGQQWSLRGGKSSLGIAKTSNVEYSTRAAMDVQRQVYTERRSVACDTIHAAENEIRGSNNKTIHAGREDRGSSIGSHGSCSRIVQTGRPVWDILNAGPRNRFTVSGRLVSNCRLFLGFGAGVNAFIPAAMIYGIVIPREQGQQFVNIFRETNKPLVDFWDANLQAAIWAVQYPGREFFVPPTGYVSWFTYGDCLCMKLPSTRLLRYWEPRLSQGYWQDGSPKRQLDLSVLVVKGRARFRRTLWRGLAMQNVTCAIEADLLCCALENMDREDVPVMLHVHDNAAAVIDEDRAESTLPLFKQCMLDMPEWTKGLPVAADCDISARFG